MAPKRDMPFAEWYRLNKSPSTGGVRGAVNPGYGMVGPPGNTASYAPTGPAYRRSGEQGLPAPYPNNGPSPNSKYTFERQDQPQPWIDDVDMASNWWSPFEPIYPYGPPWITQPREWDFPVGYNLNYIPARIELFSMLRGMRASWGILATIIATRQDQLLRIPWTIQRRDKPRSSSTGVKEMQQFFRRPDGKISYSQWTRKLLDDLLVLDAPTIYFARDRRGRPMRAEVLDGATIFPLIDDSGRRPDTVVELTDDGLKYLRRQPAFQQIIKGLPMIDLDESELMYVPMRPRTDLPIFGYPPTEQIYVEACSAIRKTIYQLNFWAEGTIPDLIVTVPKEWNPRQIASFQAHFDALLSGNTVLKSKVRFLPGDMKPFDIKNSSGSDIWATWDEIMVRLACYAYSVSPAPFVRMTNRSTAINAQQMAEEEGLFPLMSYWKDDIIDPIIQEKFGYDDIEFVFLPRPDPDQEKQAKIYDSKIKIGEMTINEARDADGLEPVPDGDVPFIVAGNAVIPLSEAVAGNAMPGAMGGGNDEDNTSPKTTPKVPPRASHPNNQPQRGGAKPMSAGNAPRKPALPAKLKKATRQELEAAQQDAKGHLDQMSHLQLKSGNYPKGHIWIQGLNISIENAPGSKRGEKDQHHKRWEITMPTAYGYIRGTIGADNEQMDVYLGKHPASTTVWVVDQDQVSKKKGKNKGFDEHKVFIGYKKIKNVLKDYLASHFDDFGEDRICDIVELDMTDFKNWLQHGDTKSPLKGQGYGKVVLKNKDLKKLGDTISSSTNLLSYSYGTAPPPRKKKRRKAKSINQHEGAVL